MSDDIDLYDDHEQVIQQWYSSDLSGIFHNIT